MTARQPFFDMQPAAAHYAEVQGLSEAEHRALADPAIGRAMDFADELRWQHNQRTPEVIKAELASEMTAAIKGMNLRGLVTEWGKDRLGRSIEVQSETIQVILNTLLSDELIPLFAAMLASDCPAAKTFVQALAHKHAQYNADGIAEARGFREDDDGYALGVGA